MQVEPIGIIRSPFTDAPGTPIQPAFAAGAEGTVEVAEAFAEGLRDLDGFERIWLVYWFARASPARLAVTPFRDTAARGVFATRAPCRPNPIGLSAVRLLRVEGCTLHVADIDVLDGTPLLDIKPYVPQFDSHSVSRSGWLDRTGADRTVADGRFEGEEPPKCDGR